MQASAEGGSISQDATREADAGRQDFKLPPSKVADPQLVASRRKRIVEAATKLFASKGFTKTSIADLCSEAEMPAGTLYLYIAKKEDLLILMSFAMLAEIESELERVERTAHGPRDRLVASIASLFSEMERHRQVVKVTYWETHRLERPEQEAILNSERRATARLVGIIEDGIKDGTFRAVDARIVAHDLMIVAHMWALKHWAFRRDYGLSLEDYTRLQTEIFLTALGLSASDQQV